MDDARRRGAVFTPHHIAASLARAAVDGRPAPRSVADPAAGDGRLLAAVSAATTVGRVFAADVDHSAWSAGSLADDVRSHFVEADALGRGLDLWDDAPPDGVELVIGNPPFLSQRTTATARSSTERERLRDAGTGVSGMADTAAAFLVHACEMLAPGGRVAMIMPLSFLSTRDASTARGRVLERCRLTGLWVSDGSVFPGAEVETCAVVLDRIDDRATDLRRWRGDSWEPAASRTVRHEELVGAATWSHLVSDLLGDVPETALSDAHGRLGDLATATAGFRDQFYGLAPLAHEVDGPPAGRTDGQRPLVTSGAIDPGRLLWPTVEARIAGRRLLRPAVDPAALDDGSALRRWVAARLVPKVLVATQTRVVEAVADPTGEWIPSTPVVSIECPGDDVFRVLAVVMAPPVTAWARRHFVGSARSAGAIKLSARQILDIPLPPDRGAWEAAANLWRAHHDPVLGGAPRSAVVDAGQVMCAAYGAGEDLHEWWCAQLPTRRRSDVP